MRRIDRYSRGVVAVLTLGLASVANAAGPGGGGGQGGGKPVVEVANNLSYPALFFGAPGQTGAIGSYRLDATFPNGLSYGCLKPETIGTTTYPNTSCVDPGASTVTPISAAACVAPGGACEGFEYVTDPALDDPATPNLERIYWQKTALNQWQAGYLGSGPLALPVDYIDWGDNLESRSWPAQIIRVETNTFATLVTPLVRFEVWHVFGQGTNELWGVHASEAAAPTPYGFPLWPYAVNNSAAARLNISKLLDGPASCPTAPGQATPIVRTWDPVTRLWDGAWLLSDAVYTAELNIKGSYVYGYNWNLRSATVPPAVNKAGWWRLTFYTPDQSVDFSTWVTPTEAGSNTLAPPEATLTPGPMALPAAEEEESGPLYVPVVDQANNLTYLDICITGTKGGGGKK